MINAYYVREQVNELITTLWIPQDSRKSIWFSKR